MKKTILIIVILIIIGLGIYYVVSNNSVNNNPPNNSQVNTLSSIPTSPQVTPQTAPKAVSSAVTIDIKNFSFNPSQITLKVGTKVTWVNNDSVPHTITSDSGNLLDSAILSPGQSFSFVFSDVGTINYHCNIHKSMKGTIVVEN